jgi:nucleotide-binding universal stress UspA family protein
MGTRVIVSYDGTQADADALALGLLLEKAGASISLAYVRHAPDAEDEAEALLEEGAKRLGDPDVPRHVVLSASTPDGLRRLAADEQVEVIAFGSEYRTTPGHVAPGTSAQRLLEGGPIAIALAPAGLWERNGAPIRTVAAVAEDGDPAPTETAASLAAALGATVGERADGDAGLVVVGSKPGTAAGRVTLSAAAAYLIEMLRCPVLVLPHGTALRFDGPGPPA